MKDCIVRMAHHVQDARRINPCCVLKPFSNQFILSQRLGEVLAPGRSVTSNTGRAVVMAQPILTAVDEKLATLLSGLFEEVSCSRPQGGDASGGQRERVRCLAYARCLNSPVSVFVLLSLPLL